MNSSKKYLVIALVVFFIGHQVSIVATRFLDTRIIEVRKEIYEGNEKDYLKSYDIVDAPFEQFDLQVKPKSLLDYLLLTNKDGNLLSLLLEIAAALCIVWYFYKLEFDDIFTLKNAKWIQWSFLLAVSGLWLVQSIGLDHTGEFWTTINKISSPVKEESWKYRFYVETKYKPIPYILAFYIFITLVNNFSGYAKAATRKPQEVS